MAVSFLSKLANNVTPQKQQQLAQQRITHKMGSAYFALSEAERGKLIANEIATLQGNNTSLEGISTIVTAVRQAAGLGLPANSHIATSTAFDKAASVLEVEPTIPLDTSDPVHESFSLAIELNAQQILAGDYAVAGKCFNLTGAAGTGKTTACRELAKRLMKQGKLHEHDFRVDGGYVMGPSIAFCAYTNRASNNMRRALHKDPMLESQLRHNILTVHSLLEYYPEFYETEEGTNTMRFIPRRTSSNQLRLTHLVIEEASMLGIDLWAKLYAALPRGCQVIFVGDINQLRPVFSEPVLSYALTQLPVVELTEVYRQALDNPIIENAHHCLKGEPLVNSLPHFRVVDGKKLTKIPSESTCVNSLINSLQKWNKVTLPNGELEYDPNTDIILCPYGKENKDKQSMANTTVINSMVAQFLGKQRNAVVYEIIASMHKLYLAVGDRVMVDKQDGIITKISHNARYLGRSPKPPSADMNRFGLFMPSDGTVKSVEDFELEMEGYESLDVGKIVDAADEKKKLEASHVVEVELDDGRITVLSQAGDFGDAVFQLGYALTVHKAQGCEWRKVIIFVHRNHAAMLCRELIYTAITRAREYCLIVDLCNMIPQGIATQRMKGNTVQEKIEYFNSELALKEPVHLIP